MMRYTCHFEAKLTSCMTRVSDINSPSSNVDPDGTRKARTTLYDEQAISEMRTSVITDISTRVIMYAIETVATTNKS
jgi:hypothetical protein